MITVLRIDGPLVAVTDDPESALAEGRLPVADTPRTGPYAAWIGTAPDQTAAWRVIAGEAVTSVQAALDEVAGGRTDLVVAGWDDQHLAEFRDALGNQVAERTAIPPVSIDEARRELPSAVFTVWLQQVDGRGLVRPGGAWAPGKREPIPVSRRRLSNEWDDEPWIRSDGASDLTEATPVVRRILEASLDGVRPTRDDVELLFRARGTDVEVIAAVADLLRERAVGETVTYVVNRNINYTNVCTYKCRFCAFSKGPRSLNLRGAPYLMSIDDVVELALEARRNGATEVCLQGGIHPGFTGDFYVELTAAIKSAAPDLHVHGFTPLEVWQGAATLGMSLDGYLRRLRDAGLGTLPGTAAEILDDRVRAHLCPDKITTDEWAEVMRTAHRLGLRSTATIMFGHIDDPASWANHFEVIRSVQEETGGFTEFVPLPFVHMGAPIFLQGRARPGPTWEEVVLMHAVARITFDGLIPNVQASWVKLGLDGIQWLLDAGCNDVGGTLMGEIITRSAGASHGQELSPEELETTIRAAGRRPLRRTTTYEPLTMMS